MGLEVLLGDVMKFTIVVVLYNKKIKDLPFYDFCDLLFSKGINLLCYDNSLHAQNTDINDPHFHYYHDASNAGLAKAYNYGLKLSTELGSDGILLLDDDTALTIKLVNAFLTTRFQDNLVAVVPKVIANGKQISPLKSDQYINRNMQRVDAGVHAEPIMSINSGSLISTQFLREIGGFNTSFPLDFLDHWLFYEINQLGKFVQVLNLSLEHDLSVMNYNNVSHQRYESIISSETRFYTQFNRGLLKEHKIQLVKRTIKLLLTQRDNYFWKRTFKELKHIRSL